MKPRTGMKSDRSGAALVIVMIVIMVVVAAGAGVVGLASQEAYIVSRIRDQIKAQAIAEAGANEAYSILKEDFSKKSDADMFPETEFDGGTYDATVITYDAEPSKAHVIVVASYGGVSATVKCDVKDFSEGGGGGSGPPPPEGAYTYAIVAGTIFWGGNGSTDVGAGDVHANGQYKHVGTTDLVCNKLWSTVKIWSTGNGTITGDAQAPAWKNKSPGNISGATTTAGVGPVALPEIDLNAYYQYALGNNEVYGNRPAGPYAPNGGVMWVNGDLHVSGGENMTGCFIATGDIHITGNSSHTQYGDLPCFISTGGDIHLSSHIDSYGLIYSKTGDISFTGGGTHHGSVFCAGEFKKTGSWAVVAYVNSTPPVDPGTGGGEVGDPPPEIGITAWHR